MTIKTEDIKIGDTVHCKRTASSGAIGLLPINRDMEFSGRVEKIIGQMIFLDTPASVRIDKVVRVE